MLGTFLESATKLLGRRFVITAWAPTVVVSALFGGVVVAVLGRERLATGWSDLDSPSQVAASVGALLVLTAAAFVLQTLPIVRFFEGYHHPWPFRQLGRAGELRRFDKLTTEIASEGDAADRRAYLEMYRSLPLDRDWVLPTRLGNVLRAAETYSTRVYGADAVHWWPRLVQVVGDEERSSLDEALIPMVALLNAAALLIIGTLVASALLVVSSDEIGWLIGVYVIGFVLTWLTYRGAVAQAQVYAESVRATMDLYRTKVLEQLRVSRPSTVADEFAIWGVLQDWLYNMNVPMQAPQGSTPGSQPWEMRPFKFIDPPASEEGEAPA